MANPFVFNPLSGCDYKQSINQLAQKSSSVGKNDRQATFLLDSQTKSLNKCNIIAYCTTIRYSGWIVCDALIWYDYEVTMKNRWLRAVSELRHHAPFTLLGAVIGILCMVLLKDLPRPVNTHLFNIFHPAHVLLSALVTASLFRMRKERTSLITILLVGYLGSIGVATLSDCIVPFWGESILGVSIPAHAHAQEHDEEHHQEHDEEHHEDETAPASPDETLSHKPELHLGFIEEWYIVNPLALAGILLAWYIPHERLHTKLPHALHVLISTWASSFHILINLHAELTPTLALGCFIVLFIAVWLPCCISDIVFPILCVGEGKVPSCCAFSKHSHTEYEDKS
jgi:hypothetical protein